MMSTCGHHPLLYLKEYWFSIETKDCNILSRMSHYTHHSNLFFVWDDLSKFFL